MPAQSPGQAEERNLCQQAALKCFYKVTDFTAAPILLAKARHVATPNLKGTEK